MGDVLFRCECGSLGLEMVGFDFRLLGSSVHATARETVGEVTVNDRTSDVRESKSKA